MANLSSSLGSPSDSWCWMSFAYEIIPFAPWSYFTLSKHLRSCLFSADMQVYFVLKTFPGSLISSSNPLNPLNLTKWASKSSQS